MAGEDIIMVSQRELKRLHIIQKVLDKRLREVEAGEILLLSDRQIRRIVSKIRQEGDKGIRHGLRGKPSSRMLPKKVKEKAIKFYREKYKGFGPPLLSEKLLELEGIKISKETLRNWLIETGDWEKVRKSRTHRQWREGKHYFGEMVQMDGSHHDWFEGRGTKCVLMVYIDDATSKAFARFHEYEGTIPAMDSFKRYIKKYGIPVSLYLARLSAYKSPGKLSMQEAAEETDLLSEFERAAKELGVEVKHAYSPQAKGRIERLFNTFQDRVGKEMRVQGIKSIEEGKRVLAGYLPGYNRRFAVQAKKEKDLHREIPEGIELDNILCIRTQRGLRNDYTVAHKKKLYQIMDKTEARKVQVEEKINGSMAITFEGRRLKFKEITERPEKQHEKPMVFISKKKRNYDPAPSYHPWRQGLKSQRLTRAYAK